MSQGPPFQVDRVGTAFIVLVGIVLVPGIIIGASLRLLHIGDWAAVSWLEWASAAGGMGVALTILGFAFAELRGAGIKVSAEGVGRGGALLPWTEVESVERKEFGVVEFRGKGQRFVLKSYLYRDRAGLEAFIDERRAGA